MRRREEGRGGEMRRNKREKGEGNGVQGKENHG